MIRAQASDIVAWTGGTLVGADVPVAGVDKDSRSLPAGALYVALPGERVDGHDFVAGLAGHAGAALVAKRIDCALPQIVVPDVLAALQALARQWLARMPATVVALTGSNGKTTTKTLTAAMLSRCAPTHATPGNYNNEIGVPLTVLGLAPGHRYAVVEMGCGKPGDIDELAAIAPPHVAGITNVGPAHLERLGSVEGVARAKAGVYRGLRAGGTAVIPADDAFARYLASQAGDRPVLRFAIEAEAEVRARDLDVGTVSRFLLDTPAGSRAVELPLPGRHNVQNALCAAALALAAGADLDAIAGALAEARPVAGRQRRLELREAVLYDDSYNANPGSLAAAIETLALEPAPRWLVLGDMAELGPEAAELHRRCGELARARGIERLYAVGPLSAAAARAFGSGAQHHARIEELIAALDHDLEAGVTVLIKGSRSARMERVLAALAGAPQEVH
jgi:UDP-N-acetylmuramoyl-tripeptide--D-alanyl-D-alanine ligase